MNEYQGFDPSLYLEHYGVLGMKWGVRRNPQRAYSKSISKLGTLDKKASKKRFKAEKALSKGEKKLYKAEITGNTRKYNKLTRQGRKLRGKAAKFNYKAAKYEKRARKWVNRMNKTFEGVKISDVSAEQLSLGKRYSLELMERER